MDEAGGGGVLVDHGAERLHGLGGEELGVGADRPHAGDRDVGVAAGDEDVARRGEPELREFAHGGGAGAVVLAEHGVRPAGVGAEPRRERRGVGEDVARLGADGGEAARGERFEHDRELLPEPAAAPGLEVVGGDDRDAAAAAGEHCLRERAVGRLEVDLDAGDVVHRRDGLVHDHHALRAGELLQVVLVDVVHDDAPARGVGAAHGHQVRGVEAERRLGAPVDEQLRHPRGETTEVGDVEAHHAERHEVEVALAQRARHEVGAVARLADHALDPLPDVGADRRVAPQHLPGRVHRHAGLLRHASQRHFVSCSSKGFLKIVTILIFVTRRKIAQTAPGCQANSFRRCSVRARARA